MVYELRFELGEYRCIALDRQMKLRRLGIRTFKYIGEQLARKFDEGEGTGSRRVNNQLAAVQQISALFVAICCVDINCIHDFVLSNDSAGSGVSNAQHSRNRPFCCKASAAAQMESNAMFERSVISNSERLPSDRFRTHSMANSLTPASELPPTIPYRPRLPSCGSHLEFKFKKVPFLSSKLRI